MATHSSTLAQKIPWMEEPGGLQSMGFRRVRHNWATSLSLFTFMHWIRKWQATPVFLPGESQGQRSLLGCRLWGCTRVRHDWCDLAAAAAAAVYPWVSWFHLSFIFLVLSNNDSSLRSHKDQMLWGLEGLQRSMWHAWCSNTGACYTLK